MAAACAAAWSALVGASKPGIRLVCRNASPYLSSSLLACLQERQQHHNWSYFLLASDKDSSPPCHEKINFGKAGKREPGCIDAAKLEREDNLQPVALHQSTFDAFRRRRAQLDTSPPRRPVLPVLASSGRVSRVKPRLQTQPPTTSEGPVIDHGRAVASMLKPAALQNRRDIARLVELHRRRFNKRVRPSDGQ